MTAQPTVPLPSDPLLAQVAAGLESVGALAEVWDAEWRLAYLTTDYLLSAGAGRAPEGSLGIGEHLIAPGTVDARLAWPAGPTLESQRRSLASWGGMLLADGDTPRLLQLADPRLRDIVASLVPEPMPPLWTDHIHVRFGRSAQVRYDGVWIRLLDDAGAFAGAVAIGQPAVGGAVLGMLALGDQRLFSRLLDLVRPQCRSIAILFADLESSTPLARALGAAEYFTLIRRLTRAIDAEVVDRDGVVGKHVGDGVTAFFVADGAEGESAAAAAALSAVPAIRAATARVAVASGLSEDGLVLRFGLHWGEAVQVGRLITAGRLEATAMGDEVNEAARIEACATGGRALASEALMKRLSPEHARGLGIDTTALRYTPLGDLASATEKARRDAPAIAVCEL